MTQATVGFLDGDGNWVPVRAGAGLPTTGGGGGGGAVTSVNGKDGEVVLTTADITTEGLDPDTQVPDGADLSPILSSMLLAFQQQTQQIGSHASTLADHDDDISNLQSSLGGKSDAVHSHAVADVSGLQDIIDGLTSRIEALENPPEV